MPPHKMADSGVLYYLSCMKSLLKPSGLVWFVLSLFVITGIFPQEKEERWMLEDLSGKDTEKIAAAVKYFSRASGVPEKALPLLVEALGQMDYTVREDAALALGKNPSAAVPYLRKGLSHKSELVREWSAKTLGQMGEPAAVASGDLLRLAFDPEWNVREAAVVALKKIPSGKAVAENALKLLKNEKEPERKIFYLKVISHHPEEKTASLFLTYLKEEDLDVREAALDGILAHKAAGKIQPQLHSPLLDVALDLISGERKNIRWKAGSLFSLPVDFKNTEMTQHYLKILTQRYQNLSSAAGQGGTEIPPENIPENLDADAFDKSFGDFGNSGKDPLLEKEGILYALASMGSTASSALPVITVDYANEELREPLETAAASAKAPDWFASWLAGKDSVKAAFAARVFSRMESVPASGLESLSLCVKNYSPSSGAFYKKGEVLAFEACLSSLGSCGKNSHASTKLIGQYLKSKNPEEIKGALLGLSRVGGNASVYTEKISSLLFHKDRDIRRWAAITLGNIGNKASDAIYELEKALQDKDPVVKAEVVRALAKIRLR